MEINTEVRDGKIEDEEIEAFIKEQCSIIRHGGSIPFKELQAIVHNFHSDANVRTRVFTVLSYANTRQRNWEDYKRQKEVELGRPLTYQEEQLAHSPAKITDEEIAEFTELTNKANKIK